MAVDELVNFFKALYPAVSGKRAAKLPPITPLPLHRRSNLERYLLMQRFSAFPHVSIFAQPLEEWPDSDLEDLHRVMLAEMAAKEARERVRKVDDVMADSVSSALAAIQESWKR